MAVVVVVAAVWLSFLHSREFYLPLLLLVHTDLLWPYFARFPWTYCP